jgi:hypothetical protein
MTLANVSVATLESHITDITNFRSLIGTFAANAYPSRNRYSRIDRVEPYSRFDQRVFAACNMPWRRNLGKTICGMVCAGTLLAELGNAPASAQTADERTFFTFSAPVELPGIGLAPGTYMFRLISPSNDHSFVQVVSADGKEIYGLFFTLPVERAPFRSQAEVRFVESPAGAPPAIRAWWNPYDSTGFEFIYPEDRCILAQRSPAGRHARPTRRPPPPPRTRTTSRSLPATIEIPGGQP